MKRRGLPPSPGRPSAPASRTASRGSGPVERGDRARLRDRVLAAEPGIAARQRLELAGERIAGLDLDRLAVDDDDRLRECHGSATNSVPSLPTTSSSARYGDAMPQSKWQSTSPGKRIRPAKRDVDAVAAEDLHPRERLRLRAGDEARAADAVAPDVHQRAALELGAQADVAGREPPKQNCARITRSSPTPGDQLAQPRGLRRVAPHERLHQHAVRALGGVEGALGVRGMARQRLLAQHVLAGLQRPDRPLDVHRVRQRDVDRVDASSASSAS